MKVSYNKVDEFSSPPQSPPMIAPGETRRTVSAVEIQPRAGSSLTAVAAPLTAVCNACGIRRGCDTKTRPAVNADEDFSWCSCWCSSWDKASSGMSPPYQSPRTASNKPSGPVHEPRTSEHQVAYGQSLLSKLIEVHGTNVCLGRCPRQRFGQKGRRGEVV